VKALATATAVLTLAGAGATPAAAGNGGVAYTKQRVHKRAARPVLVKFAVGPSVLSPGATPTVTFLVKSRARQVRVRLVVSRPGTTDAERVVDLGRRPTNAEQSVPVPDLADATLPEGALAVRIAGRDTAGKLLRPAAHLSRIAQLEVRAHAFPLVGEFSYGDAGARFGAARNGHTHQGQDLFADEGTPVVAVRGGTIAYVEYQKRGAGWYVVLDADGEDYDYAFMHLQEGSIPVVKGQHVDIGERIGGVGHTGDAQGNHLHFEVWEGAWFDGGHAVDPLPFLQLWQTSSAAPSSSRNVIPT
jgi:murein DD-endopeptidase MepM/ murein hydrolase activator NlpD